MIINEEPVLLIMNVTMLNNCSGVNNMQVSLKNNVQDLVYY